MLSFIMFIVVLTEEVERQFRKLDASEYCRAMKILKQLQEHGDIVGTPLAGLWFFREKRINGKRLYYLAYPSLMGILIVAVSEKKSQQATIDRIIADIARYGQIIHDKLK